jgi:hypothetical protein
MLIEMQSRYVAKVFSKKVKLSSQLRMKWDYEAMKEKQSKEFSYDYERVQGIVDPYDYMDLMGNAIGAIPSCFMNFELFKIVYFGSWSHYYNMLNHPDKKKRDIATKEIMKLKDIESSSLILQSSISKIKYLLIMMILLFIIYYFITWKDITKKLKHLKLLNR